MPLRTLVAAALLTLSLGCGESEEDAAAAVREQARQDAVERARTAEERACRSGLLALENERNGLDSNLRNLENERTVAAGMLTTLRAQPTPDPAAIAAQEAEVARLENELTRVRAEREVIDPRIAAHRAKCAR